MIKEVKLHYKVLNSHFCIFTGGLFIRSLTPQGLSMKPHCVIHSVYNKCLIKHRQISKISQDLKATHPKSTLELVSK